MRIIAALGLSAALALTASFAISTDAEAAKKAKSKACSTTNMMTGKKASWKCGGAEKCCYDTVSSKGTCVPASGICL
jgi:hypothetical protein